MGKNDMTTGEFREKLLDCFEKAMAGELTNEQIKGIIGTSNQLNANFAAEIRLQQFELKAGKAISDLGNVHLGSHTPTGIPTGTKKEKDSAPAPAPAPAPATATTATTTTTTTAPGAVQPKKRGRPKKA